MHNIYDTGRASDAENEGGEESPKQHHSPTDAPLSDRLPQVVAPSADEALDMPAPMEGCPAASDTGKLPRLSSLGASPTPHVQRAEPPAPDEERDQLREPAYSAEVVTGESDAHWPGSQPPTVDPYGPRPKRSRKKLAVFGAAAAVLALVAVGVGLYAYFNPAPVGVTVNGIALSVSPTITVQQLEDEAVAAGMEAPAHGNHLAIDGSMLAEGGGEPYTVTIDGAVAGSDSVELHEGSQVVFENGADTTEAFTTEEVPAPPQVERVGTGAIHAYIPGTSGTINRKTGTESGIQVDEITTEPVNGQLKCYNADTGGEKVIALTFDDGPWANPDTTRQILDILEENDARATFFTVGNCIKNASDQVKRAFDAGHEVLTHSRDHAKGDGNGVDLTRMDPEDQIAEITEGYDAIEAVTGVAPATIIRAPGGNFDGDILTTLAPYVTYEIGWNIDTMDWSRPGVEEVEKQLMRAGSGDIVLMHDGGGDRSETVEALKTCLPKLKKEGYRFVTVSELLAYNDPEAM